MKSIESRYGRHLRQHKLSGSIEAWAKMQHEQTPVQRQLHWRNRAMVNRDEGQLVVLVLTIDDQARKIRSDVYQARRPVTSLVSNRWSPARCNYFVQHMPFVFGTWEETGIRD